MLTLDNVRSIFKLLPISYLIIKVDPPIFSVADVNEEFIKTSGSKSSNLIGKDLFAVLSKLSPDFIKHHQEIEANLTNTVQSKKSSTLKLPNWTISLSPVTDHKNELSYIVHTFEAVNHHKGTDELEKLKDEKHKYHTLFNLSPLPHWVYSLKTLAFLDVNDAAIEHYGYTKEEFLAMTLPNIRPLEDVKILEQIITQSVEKGVYNSSIVRHKKKNGEIITVLVQGNSLPFEGEEARLVMVMDKTEKIKAENALAASERRFKALIQEGSDMIAIIDLDGNLKYTNPSTTPILGVSDDFLNGKNVFSLVHPDDKGALIENFKKLKTHHRVRFAPFRLILENDNYRWIESTMVNMTDDPAIGGIVSNSRDVTERIENELKMEESIARYAIVSKATSDAIWDHDFSTGKVIWNKGLKGIFGHNRSNYTHKWWISMVHPDDVAELAEKVEFTIKNNKTRFASEYRFRCADGNYKYIQDRAFVLFNREGKAIRMIGSMQDITDRVNHTKAMEQQNQRLKDISWMQSHHLRAPLARILGLTNLLSEEDNTESDTKEFLEYLNRSSLELDKIIREIIKKTEGN